MFWTFFILVASDFILNLLQICCRACMLKLFLCVYTCEDEFVGVSFVLSYVMFRFTWIFFVIWSFWCVGFIFISFSFSKPVVLFFSQLATFSGFPTFSSFPGIPNGNFQMFPIMYPALVTPPQNEEQVNRGAGIYAVANYPFIGPVAGIPPNTLIPLTYNVPT